MAKGDPIPSPWIWSSGDYLGRKITITIPFDNATRTILDGGTIVRDLGCLWSVIVWGVPSDPSAVRSPSVPFGTTTFTAAQVQSFSGFTSIDQILAVQVTAEAA